MRAVLIANPQATATTPGGRDVLVHALANVVDLEVVETTHRGHATALARKAVAGGADLVVTHGGDGTVNEVVNGIAGAQAPSLAVVPGGSANVFARAVGYPADPIEATHVLIEALREGRSRRIGLGKVEDRLFTFSAGMGWDADTIAAVDSARGKQASPLLYVRSTTLSYFTRVGRRPKLRVDIPGEASAQVRALFVTNADPWTYLGDRPVRLNPGVSFDTGIGLLGPYTLDPLTVATTLQQAMTARGVRSNSKSLQRDDLTGFTVCSDVPVKLQVDGDLVGERTRVGFRSVPDALTVVV